ncbi:hypothetical protein EJB05_41824, partial [Eragrostis curvula]
MVERLELRVLDTDGNVLRTFENASKLLAPARLDLICFDRMQNGAMIIDPAAGLVVTVGGHDPPAGARRFTSLSHSSFGRAAPSGAYKVLRLHESAAAPDGHGELCEVATLGDGAAEPTWRQRPAPPFLTIWSCARKATVHGVLYFMPRNASGTPHGWNRVAAFDLESEERKETIHAWSGNGVQEGRREVDHCSYRAQGHLAWFRTPDGHYTNIWLLINSEKSIWVKEYTIQMPKHWILLKALGVLVDGRVLLLNALKREEERTPGALQYILQYYDPGTGAFTDKMKMTEDFRGEMTLYT